jgi:DNA polymerase-3 subunit gamma/tau
VELTLLKITYLPSVYQPAAQPAVEGGAGKKSESKPIAPAVVAAAPEVVSAPVIAPEPAVSPEPAVALAPTVESPTPARPTSHGLRSAKKVGSVSPVESTESGTATEAGFQEPFTFDQVQLAWTQISLGYKKSQFINKFVLMDREINLIDSVIHIKVEGEAQIQQFNDSLKLELISQLREKLKNESIDVSLDLLAGEVSDKKLRYTQSDKYEFLSQKHPILIEMKQRMGLDYEF